MKVAAPRNERMHGKNAAQVKPLQNCCRFERLDSVSGDRLADLQTENAKSCQTWINRIAEGLLE